MDYLKINAEVWDKHAEDKCRWSIPVSKEDIENARNGIWEITLTPRKHVPKNWFPSGLKEKKILLIAGSGGQQGPILAALGAEVTVFDISKKQLEQDEFVSKRENLNIKTIHGNMQDLSVFPDKSFDFIMQFAGGFVDYILPVWNEAYRVLKNGGSMIAAHYNPFLCIFDQDIMEQKNELKVRHKIPYSDINDLKEEEFNRITAKDGVFFCHTLHDLIQGQIDAGFLIAGFYEDSGEPALDNYINAFFATKAIKV